MMPLVYIVAIFATLLSLLIIVIAVSGVESCRAYMAKIGLMLEGESELLDTYNDIGISIVVSGFRQMEDVQHLLSLNHLRYEVVLLTDLTSDENAGELLECYSMVVIDKTLSDELPCSSIRAVYRSRERRYHKLVVVDRQRTTLSQEFNCGVNLCSYEYVMAVDGWSRFNSNSLQYVVTELFEQSDDKRVYAVGGFKAGVLPQNRLRIIDTVMRMVVLGAGMSEVSKIAVEAGIARTADLGRYSGTAIVFDREALIDAGGYQSDFYPDSELYSRIRKTMKYRHVDASALFIPQVLTFEQASEALSPSAMPLSNATLIERIVSRRVSMVFYLVCIIMLAVAMLTENRMQTEIVSLALFMTYCVTVAVAALALTVADKLLLRHFNCKSSLQLIPSLLIYPFFLLYCLLSPKKFY